MHRAAFVEEAELGWRAAGAIERENEGPQWQRRLIISFRVQDMHDYGGPKNDWHEARPAHVMM